jgi:hypothetical protein
MSSKLAGNFLPRIGGSADLVDVHSVERESSGFELRVMAADAVLVENFTRGNSGGRHRAGRAGTGRSCGTLRLRVQIAGTDCHDADPAQLDNS